MTVSVDALADEFADHRAHLMAVGYRLTGAVTDAEDAVQEAWLRLSTLDIDRRAEIRDLRGWLTTVVGRICLDRLRSAAVRRETYVGEWLPEPVVTPFGPPPGDDPLDSVVRADGVRMAAMVVLDKLTPEQRVAFVLHDAFSVPFGEIAETLGCSTASARQHASRGRKALADADPPPRAPLQEQRELIERFLAAVASGDIASVVKLLHPDAVLVGDSDGKARTARRHMVGADKIARFLMGLMEKYTAETITTGQLVLVNGDLGMAMPQVPADGHKWEMSPRITSFAVRDGKIVSMYDVVNPDKLTHVELP
ncbi:RNA polymerase sigma-70 factor (ECF subfamily) [Herbihabitans rhizosphaerae]|uniref:RNA polymerase sigma-70 factor (ECF subfamily) n=1 Tax=Herbihabitans rhizosphaerae TaxID=1872711 RepID=A0A4Q7KDI0_9PSEU|nr:sigma-70 family RNA polymerase sigma factor [Herbihabitans rhizosphaerae]RZS29649.1 RNA polymerase sigma-70 factor (ECF subfamily) [Herbihabitans rhizosphaerae]